MYQSSLQSGAFVVAKADVRGNAYPPTLWRIDGKALLQKFLPFKEDVGGKTFYKSTSTVSARRFSASVSLFYKLEDDAAV